MRRQASSPYLHQIESWHPHEVSVIVVCFGYVQLIPRITDFNWNKHTDSPVFRFNQQKIGCSCPTRLFKWQRMIRVIPPPVDWRGWAYQPTSITNWPALMLPDPTVCYASQNMLNWLLIPKANNHWLTFMLLRVICIHTHAFQLLYSSNLFRQSNFVLGVIKCQSLQPKYNYIRPTSQYHLSIINGQ